MPPLEANMPATGEGTETVQVKTRVPKYQRDEWKVAAERLGMTQSEFVRTMVQAGRSGFDASESGACTSSPAEGPPGGADPGGDGLESRVESALADAGAMSWDKLVAELAGDFEDRLEGALDALQSSNRIQHSPREGGYVLTDGGA